MLSLYGTGTSYADISEHFRKMYDVNYSPSFITRVTNRVIDEIEKWKSRPLEILDVIRSRSINLGFNNLNPILCNGCHHLNSNCDHIRIGMIVSFEKLDSGVINKLLYNGFDPIFGHIHVPHMLSNGALIAIDLRR
jgi:hypothetical protein